MKTFVYMHARLTETSVQFKWYIKFYSLKSKYERQQHNKA